MNKYSYNGKSLSAGEVHQADKDTQQGVMEEWFYRNFEDPANETPYLEGEYFYLYGGPYEAEDVLREEFEDIVLEEAILSLVSDINGQGWEWAPAFGGNFHEQGFTDIPCENFRESIGNIETLLTVEFRNTHPEHNLLFYRLLYVNVITVFEIYLRSTISQQIDENKDLLPLFIETISKFRRNGKSINNEISSIERLNWRELGKVYKGTLKVKFPENYTKIREAIDNRNYIAHRNGKFPEGGEVKILHNNVVELISKINKFVSDIEDQID